MNQLKEFDKLSCCNKPVRLVYAKEINKHAYPRSMMLKCFVCGKTNQYPCFSTQNNVLQMLIEDWNKNLTKI